MAQRTITDALTIPSNESSSNGNYTDLALQLVFINGSAYTVAQTVTNVPTTNTYQFTFNDDGQKLLVCLRTFTGAEFDGTIKSLTV